ncbi:MAG: chorismate-binding protein [Sphingopyxis sp.]|jgi:anthranilate synthase component 1|nr:chorismate-binding protein [Sphingopyxis sp.]
MTRAAISGIDAAQSALAAGQSSLLWARIVADTETPISAALKLFVAERGDWMLESVEGGETRGRHSLIGIDPDWVFQATGTQCAINREWQYRRDAFAPVDGNPVDVLRSLVAQCTITTLPADLPPTLACLVGYFAYETYGLIERLPRPQPNPVAVPDMMFVRPTVILVFDRLSDQLTVVAPIWADDRLTAADAAARAIERASDRIEQTLARLAQAVAPPRTVQSAMDWDATDLGQRPNAEDSAQVGSGPLDPPTLAPTMADGQYRDMVLAAKEHIVAGDIFQVVLAQRFTTPFALPPMHLYRALRRINPSPFLYFLDFPGFAVVGSSPEILVRVRDGDVTIRPIAGTRPRGATAAEDIANREALLADPKECAEHLMLLDLGRNDIGRASAPGTVKVTESFTVEYYSHVMHIVSNVTARLADGQDALDAMFAGFPAGTVSGAPKVRAAEIIAALEPETRGPYAGGVGYFSPNGTMDSCIVLRTGIVKDGVLHVTAGAGIVADSDPAYEQRECEAKAGALLAAAREAVTRAAEAGYGQ